MANQFDCIVDGCEFMVRSEDEDEVVDMVQQHGQNHHPDVKVTEEEIRQNIEPT